MTSIVLLTKDHWSMTHSLLYSLYRLERTKIDELILMDDCSQEDETIGGLNWWRTNKLLPIRIVRNDENLGFLRTANRGLKLAKNGTIILLSNDVEVSAPFIPYIEKIMSEVPGCLIGGRLLNESTGWNKFGDRVFPYLEGWLLAADSSIWADLNYFDERYVPMDFEDVDLSTKALSLNYRLMPLNLPQLRHIGAATYGYTPEREKITQCNRKKFEEKWMLGDDRNHYTL